MNTVDVHTLTGAYAVDALSPEERREFEAHLEHCSACAQEARELAATTARLALATSTAAPPGMRERVLAEVGRTRQRSPRTGPEHREPLLPWYRQPLAAAAVALFVVSLGLGAALVGTLRQADDATQRADRIAAIAADPNRVVHTGAVETGGAATVAVAGADAVFRAEDLAALSGDLTYQLWVIDESGARSAGVLERHEDGSVQQLVTGVDAGDEIGLTVEPRGGSDRPTTQPILQLPVDA
jgi:anti-sigma-K factor RskA